MFFYYPDFGMGQDVHQRRRESRHVDRSELLLGEEDDFLRRVGSRRSRRLRDAELSEDIPEDRPLSCPQHATGPVFSVD